MTAAVQQYGRQVSVVVANAAGKNIDFADFRCVFSVKRGDYQNPNQCDVKIYNLSDQTANTIAQPEFSTLTIRAGYPGNYGQIFTGTITQFRTGRDNARESFVAITAADGDEAYNFATISVALAAGAVNPQSAANQFLNTMTPYGVSAANPWPAFSSNGSVRGQVFYGRTRDELRQFAQDNKCSWSIQDGKLTFVPLQQPLPGEAIALNSLTGLIGVPEQTPQGIVMKCLLNPSIKIGSTVKLDNKTAINLYRFSLDVNSLAQNTALKQTIKTNADGIYYVMVANHSGDTRGNEWYTDLTCLAVDASALPGLAFTLASPLGTAAPLPAN